MSRPHIHLHDLVRQHRLVARAAARHGGPGAEASQPLEEVAGFGSNPGALKMLRFVPEGLPPGAALVVALHGCTQTAAGYAAGTGWPDLAERHGFALLLPEQAQGNNMNRCFNWFEPVDTRRDAGEALSIRQMVARMAADHAVDAARVFVTGLSAGGAMTSTLLATYPELFAAGAIIAGLPHGAAQSMPEAFEAMAGSRPRSATELAAAVRTASPHRGPWPRVAIWQGDADHTVRPANAERIRQQWAALHELEGAPDVATTNGPHRFQAWRDGTGTVVLENHAIAGMAHGVPLDPAGGNPDAAGTCGVAGPFMLDVGVSSTHRIAAFFGLDGVAVAADQPTPHAAAPVPRGAEAKRFGGEVIAIGRDGQARVASPRPPLSPTEPQRAAPDQEPVFDPGKVIRQALTAAGLMKP